MSDKMLCGNTAALREWELDQERRDTSRIPDDERRDAEDAIARKIALEWIDDAWDSLLSDTRAYERFKAAMQDRDYTEMGRIIMECFDDSVRNSVRFRSELENWEQDWFANQTAERGDELYDRWKDRE